MGAGGALLPNGRTEWDRETLCWRFHTVKYFEEEVCVPQAWGELEATRPQGEAALEARASGSSWPNAADAGGAPPLGGKGPSVEELGESHPVESPEGEAACHCRHHHHPTIPPSASVSPPSSVRHLGVLSRM